MERFLKCLIGSVELVDLQRRVPNATSFAAFFFAVVALAVAFVLDAGTPAVILTAGAVLVYCGVFFASRMGAPTAIPVGVFMTATVVLSATVMVIVGQLILAYQDQQRRISSLNEELTAINKCLCQRNLELEAANDEIHVLRGIIPICADCKRLRTSEGYYQAVDTYLHDRPGVRFTHTICEECASRLYPEIGDGTTP